MIRPIKSVYLAGPIDGLTHDEARYGWREEFYHLVPDHIVCYSPMRAKDFLKDVGVLKSSSSFLPNNPFSTEAGILTRDANDVRSCDLVLACFLESNGKLSGGTMIEYGMAHAWGKPVVAVGLEDDPNIYHCMASRIAGYRVETLEEAAKIVFHLLTPGL